MPRVWELKVRKCIRNFHCDTNRPVVTTRVVEVALYTLFTTSPRACVRIGSFFKGNLVRIDSCYDCEGFFAQICQILSIHMNPSRFDVYLCDGTVLKCIVPFIPYFVKYILTVGLVPQSLSGLLQVFAIRKVLLPAARRQACANRPRILLCKEKGGHLTMPPCKILLQTQITSCFY